MNRNRWPIAWSTMLMIAASSLAVACAPADTIAPTALTLLERLRASLAGADFESHVLTIGGRITLSVWYVLDTDDDWLTAELTRCPLPAGPEQAALLLLNRLLRLCPEAQQVVDIFNPMIVQPDHTCLMQNMIPIAGLARGGYDDPIQLYAAIRAIEDRHSFVYRRQPHTAPFTQPDAGWEAARSAIKASTGSGNTAVYRIIGAPGDEYRPGIPTVYVQFQAVIPNSTPAEHYKIVTSAMLSAFASLQATSPAVVRLESFWVDNEGHTALYARLDWPLAGQPGADDIQLRPIGRPEG